MFKYLPARFVSFTRRASQIRIAIITLGLLTVSTASSQNMRVLGIDVSTYQGNISAANWATLKRATNQQVGGIFGDGRAFVVIRSTRGGTTGEDHRQGGYTSPNNTFYSESCRYDDRYFVQNINLATAAGLFAGCYHFARPDIVATSVNSDGTTVAGQNTGTDEANHMLQMASPWMRPGFLPPVLDLEAGDGIRSDNAMAQFCVDFSDRIYAVMGIRPAIYINGNYAANVLAGATTPTPAQTAAAFPVLWSARWPNQADPNSIDWQNTHPKDTYTPIYGPWDDVPNPTHPWKFWQYASTAHVNAIGNGTANCDVDVAQGGIEFVKDQLVPAIWVTNADGEWTTLTNWNSGLTPVAPVPGPGQLTPVGTNLPTPRLPSTNDTVILDRPSPVAVTLSSGTQNIRRLYMRETLNITGGALNINYTPSWDSTNIAAQFSGPVTLSGSASLSVHTLLVDATRTFTLNGGKLTANTINLTAGATPAKILMGGDVTFVAFSNNATATITNGAGSGTSGSVDLNAGTRTFSVTNSSELLVTVPISNGGLTKAGAGTMRLTAANTYGGGTTVSAGKLMVNNTTGSGTGAGGVTVNGGTLGGIGTISGIVTVDSGGTLYPGPGTSMGTLTLNSAPVFDGTNFMKINRNGGASLSDKVSLTSGIMTLGGTLVVSNAGATLVGGEMFTNFAAPARAGAFAASVLPTLNSGLNWYLGDLVGFGRIKVNRGPAVTSPGFTNTPAAALQIPIASLTANVSDADGDAVTLAGIDLISTNGVALVTNGTFIVYSNSVNVPDRILYTVSDGHGGSATGAVAIAASTVGQFIGTVSASNNTATVQFAGGPGSTYYVERSVGLPDWVTISTNVMPADGILNFTDDFHDLVAPPEWALYRLRW